MKIQIENPNEIVSSAFFEESVSGDSFSLFITTNLKNASVSCVASSSSEKTWYYENVDVEEKGEDFVSLIAETEEDIEILARLEFRLMSKNQLWILFPKESVWSMEDRITPD